MMTLLLGLALQAEPRLGLLEAIDASHLPAVRKAIEFAVARDEERAARLMVQALPRARRRFELLDRALADAKRALQRYSTMEAITQTDQEERTAGIEASKKRIEGIIRTMQDTEDVHEAVRGAWRLLKSDKAAEVLGVELERSAFWLNRCEAAFALGSMGTPDGERRLRERLDRESHATVVAAILDALALQVRVDEPTRSAVLAQLGAKSWRIQTSAAQALAGWPARESVEPLIRAMAGVDGRPRNEIDAALRKLTKADAGGDASGWSAWWKDNGEDFLAGRYDPKNPKRAGAGRTTFFQMPVVSERLVFVIDQSASMAEASGEPGLSKMDVAKRELKAFLAVLPERARVNLLFFNDDVSAFSVAPRPMTPRTRKDAAEFMDRIVPKGPTNLYDAFDRAHALVGNPETGAFRDDGVDTIVILSDGHPTAGMINDEYVLLRRFTRLNRYLRAAIHAVSIGDTGSLLTELAEKNDGGSTRK